MVRLPWGMRWWELVPEALLALGLGVFLVTEPSAATSAFRSDTAIALMALAGVAWITGRLLLGRYTRWPVLRLVVFALAAVAVLNLVVLPAYDDTTVVERLPVATGGSPGRDEALSPPPAGPTPAVTVPPTGPVTLGSSAIHGIDHRASGSAVIYRQTDGSVLVGLEGIDIQPGPDYDVYVVPGPGREDTDGGVRLDDLRGNKGTQYYVVPAGTDVTTGRTTVLVWCQTFDVPVAAATPV